MKRYYIRWSSLALAFVMLLPILTNARVIANENDPLENTT